LTGLDVNSPSWDLFIFLFFIVATFVYGFTLGRSRIMVLLISTYMALALVETAPFLQGSQSVTVGSSPFFIVQITAFIATMLLIFFFLSNSALRKAFAAQEVQGKAWQIIAFSILHAGLLVAIVLSFVPEARQAGLLPFTSNLFATNTALFIWAVLPIVVMMFVNDPEEE
jgi:glucose dehydrogenase